MAASPSSTGIRTSNGVLSYDAGSDRYEYNWKTDPAWANTCRHLNITLIDNTTQTADFAFH